MVRFVTNSISTRSNPKTLSDIIKAAQTRAAMEKEASSETPVVKTASSAVVTAEIKVSKKKEKPCPSCKGKGCPKCAPKTAAKEKAEAESSGQPEVEAKLVNDPHDDPKLKGQSKGKGKAKSEEAESSGQLEPAKNPQNNPEVKESTSSQWIKVANLSKEQKAVVRKVWSKFWPAQFIDALLADQ